MSEPAKPTKPAGPTKPAEPAEPAGGVQVERLALVGVVAQLLATVATASANSTVANIGVIVLVAVFAVGLVVFFAAFVLAAGRSRYDAVWFGGAFLLNGGVVTPRARRLFYSVLGAQTAIGLVASVLRPFTPTTFSILAIVLGFGCMAYYGARYGTFPPQSERR